MNIQESLKNKIKNISEQYKEDKTGGYITGDGPIPCDILFIGEAPGKNEVEEGKPFVGMAGKRFEKFLNSIGLKRESVRITNTCFFRPIKIKESKNGRISVSNRTPKVSEISLFSSILNEEINLVDPKLIITLGNVPLKTLTNFKSIGDCHGNIYFIENLNRYVFPMYHPSSLTYNRNKDFHKMYENDWLKLKEILNKI
ncbi:uracil-DNA glycosylase [Clostridium tepidum]|uniref:Uracil-DNA glycosylase n=1 Tax=Clostridium tepidum TaxID=1962263 RepID=A0A1S9HWG4_9CLOT|nr:uracil-DNA glycosylase [Clostridium tepidum]MCR1935669.1 uracil-DNA glycosylase [Clostridium tepidum]OOO61210.1 uracil-DNA glycosylase [Clostridium tepidum]OOO62406.1 uracil-DNA glycosylase [Clostridium tepidum]